MGLITNPKGTKPLGRPNAVMTRTPVNEEETPYASVTYRAPLDPICKKSSRAEAGCASPSGSSPQKDIYIYPEIS